MLGSGNPVLNENTFDLDESYYNGRSEVMTAQGTVFKTMVLLAICIGTGTFTWGMVMDGTQNPMPWVLGGALGGFALAMVTIFKQAWAPYTAPLYAAAEGLFLGAISAIYEAKFGHGGLSGIVAQSVGLTLGVTAAMLILYTFRIIRVTEKLRAGILMATGGVALFYIASIVLSLFGVPMGVVYSASPLSIGISLIIVVIAAFNLLMDFDLIEHGSKAGAPKYMEWYGAFALMVTLVWLYLEILRLLSKLQSRN